MGFPETNPQMVTAVVDLPVTSGSGVTDAEVVLMRTPKKGSITNVWAMSHAAAAATANLTVTFYNRGTASGAGTAYAGTTELDVLGGAATAWVAKEPRQGTVSNGTAIAANSYIAARVQRSAASTATAFTVSCGAVFVPGDPAAVGSIGA